ncbi:hypothetical protein FVR03_20290 [Pontibacter qinzhouensis]|uniref:Uncharacterized protein n=1 Tax=Pontibacter qinzhouensis TaxID=2603253 RepID=A0A5C8J451_9BACT|nr:hypothetical protein [Pontibacter qinzhouensis]TXK29862.1 hypothetical protein FVR03_20290 [Pontibacter qinzhouensis]
MRQDKGLRLWLIDMRKTHYTTITDQLWTVKEFLPALDLRLQYRTACVVSLHSLDLIPESCFRRHSSRTLR